MTGRTLHFFAQGVPKSQPRPKACIRGRHAGVYDPGTANDWKTIVRVGAIQAWDRVRFEGPVDLTLCFVLARPQSHFRANGELKPGAPRYVDKKPDFENLTKAVADALTNAGVWRDDSQVCTHAMAKRYSNGEPVGCYITIRDV